MNTICPPAQGCGQSAPAREWSAAPPAGIRCPNCGRISDRNIVTLTLIDWLLCLP